MDCRQQFSSIGDGLLVLAPAKINLSLLIAGKRPDGYHEIETLMSKVSLYDELLFEKTDSDRIELLCRGDYWAPQGPENLVYRACRNLLDVAGVKAGVKITLTKNIPAGGGLGGASSDAAAALLGLNRFVRLGVEHDTLVSIAAQLGSDVTFFLGGPLAFCTGRGEKVEEIPEKFSFRAVLVLPNVNVSTAKVYANYRHDLIEYDKLSRAIKAFIAKKDIDSTAKMCANMLEKSCFELYGELAKIKSKMKAAGAGRVCLSGSGSTMFCLLTGADQEIERCQSILSESFGCSSLVVHNNRW